MKPRRRNNLSSKQVGNEKIIHDPETDTVHVLNRTASFIWDLIDGSKSLSEIEQELIKKFPEQDPAKLSEDIRKTITDFSRKKLIEYNKKEKLLEAINKDPSDKKNHNLLGITYMAE